MIAYRRKLIVSGQIYELYEYENLIFKGLAGVKKNLSQVPEERTRIDNINRTRNEIRRTINSNPDLNKFITLTFRANMRDIKVANYEFKKFMQRLEYYEKKPVRYFNVIEFQKRGCVHYHMLSDIDFIEKEKLAFLWGQGFIKINRISTVDNIGAYVSKYLTKETMTLKGHKKYFCSRDLERAREYIKEKDIDFKLYEAKITPDVLPVYEKTYESEAYGSVVYRQFNLGKLVHNF